MLYTIVYTFHTSVRVSLGWSSKNGLLNQKALIIVLVRYCQSLHVDSAYENACFLTDSSTEYVIKVLDVFSLVGKMCYLHVLLISMFLKLWAILNIFHMVNRNVYVFLCDRLILSIHLWRWAYIFVFTLDPLIWLTTLMNFLWLSSFASMEYIIHLFMIQIF